MDIELNKTYNLDEEHFGRFKGYFEYWVEVFGLKEWEIAYYFSKPEDDEGVDARAAVQFDHSSRIAVVQLNREWFGSKPTNEQLSKCAYHEVLELLLGKLNELTRVKTTDNEITGEIHRVIRIFENTHFTTLWGSLGEDVGE